MFCVDGVGRKRMFGDLMSSACVVWRGWLRGVKLVDVRLELRDQNSELHWPQVVDVAPAFQVACFGLVPVGEN